MQAYYRNKQTGEIKLVEQDTAEMFALQQEVGQDGHSKWEQTSFAHAGDVLDKAATGELEEADLGKDHQAELRHAAVTLSLEGVAPENNPHLALTPGEIEAGLTPEQKLEDLKDMFDQASLDARGAILNQAADLIADERVENAAAQQARGLRARAGGSDERENVPRATASEGDAGAASSESGGSVAAAPGGRQAPAVPAAGSGSTPGNSTEESK